jgi:hypothetical protein
VKYKGQWYFVYHTADAPGGGEFRRSVCVDYMYFNSDGTIQRVIATGDGVDPVGNITSEPTSEPTATPVPAPTSTPSGDYALLDQSRWSLVYVDSEETSGEDGAATSFFDGDTSTIWHTEWEASNPTHPHEIQIDFGGTYNVGGIRYLARQDEEVNGTIADYEVYVSTSTGNWGSAVASGTWANDKSEKEVLFGPVAGRYVRLRALSEVAGNAWTSGAELYVLVWSGGPTMTPAPTSPPTDTPAPTDVQPTEGPMTGVQPVYMKPYTINSTLWNDRISRLISNWIPHLYSQCNNTNLAEGGINNFIQAQRKNNGQSYSGHVGYWFSPVWVLGTFESMCLANMVGGNFTSQINNWLPTLLGAQESDGYMSTWHQLGNNARWSSAHRDAHEGYVAQAWIEAGIAHYLSTGSTQFLDAAKKLADCWYNNAPGQGGWWDGHQGIKLALCRLARLTGDNRYAQLARTLLEVRQGGGTYDQSHQLPKNQSEAVGHAVRAAYMYAGMADVAAVLNDSTYSTASDRLWDNVTNCKFYVTGGLGSGESSEGFGGNYSLCGNRQYVF